MQRYYHSWSISQCRLMLFRGVCKASACPSLYRVIEGESECPKLRDRPLYMRAETSVYTQGNFRIYENKFLHIRKNISAYTKINSRIYASLSAHIRGLSVLISPVVWREKCGAKEHYHLDKSDRPRTVTHRGGGSPWTICLAWRR